MLQVQMPFEHCAFGPQGEGLHGSVSTGATKKKKKKKMHRYDKCVINQ
jgi:hypothetical protein